MRKQVARLLRNFFIKDSESFTLTPINRAPSIKFPRLHAIDLYLHIPFCKSICPYCPYNKIKYDKNIAQPYLKALLTEIDHYHGIFGNIDVPSLYIGGGTPTTFIDELESILNHLRNRFKVLDNICVETNPSDLANREHAIQKLADYGVTNISVSIQSFNDKYLRLIGRDYKSPILYPIIERLLAYNFKTVNLDLTFGLPNQSVQDAIEDVQAAINAGVNQITLYPQLTFPYSIAGKYLKLSTINKPSFSTRRSMYRAIYQVCHENGFEQVSLWSFKRGNTPRYSSIGREFYLGLGASAGSHIPGLFYLNTFLVKVYIATCLNKKLPIALTMNFSEEMTNYHWLYCQFYNTFINKQELRNRFGYNNKKINALFKIIKALGFCTENDNSYHLTEKGSFWFHVAQNQLVLDPMNKVWSTAMKDPWPQKITL